MPNKGYRQTIQHRKKLSDLKKELYQREEKHPQWKGEKASYRAKHQWVERKFGNPDKCEKCKKSGLKGHDIHWSNISGKYKRIKSDWLRLCVQCHADFDKSKRSKKIKKI